MNRPTLLLLISAFSAFSAFSAVKSSADRPPNVIIMFADDQGYGDLGCFGATDFDTPHLDRLAAEGIRLTDFYVSSPVCSASRSALLTGCYHSRVSIHGALGPPSPIGLGHDEVTIAELLKQKNYATAIFGKWHLGRPGNMLPANHGFDEYFGLPYSNDMWPFHPNVLHLPMEERLKKWPRLPLVEGTAVIDEEITPEEQRNLTTWYTEHAVDFIGRHREQPFFLYVPQSMPHVPLYVSGKFEGKSKNGIFGDVNSEIDWSMGEILAALDEHGLGDNTLVIYTSDNGPWLSYGAHGGSAGPLREGKGTCWEGGVRVPFIARWPGKIPAGAVSAEPAMTIDLLPTIAAITQTDLPAHRIDGKDIWPILSGEDNAVSPHEALFFYYGNNQLQGMRSGKWKLIFPHKYRTLAGRRGTADGLPIDYETLESGLELYDLSTDIGETTNLADQHPEVIARLQEMADGIRAELGDSLRKIPGKANREPAKL